MSVGEELYETLTPLVQQYGDPDDALLTYMTGIGIMFQPVDDMAKDGPNGEPGWSQVIDLTRAKTEWLPWLGQWVGYYVPEKAESQTDEEYDELERGRIISRSSHRRGSIPILREVVQEHLNDPKDVIIDERTSSPHQIHVYIYNTQIATTAAQAEAAARRQKAAGLIMTFTILGLGSVSYTNLQAANTDYTEVITRHVDYTSALTNPGL
jgi:hypothetical protein